MLCTYNVFCVFLALSFVCMMCFTHVYVVHMLEYAYTYLIPHFCYKKHHQKSYHINRQSFLSDLSVKHHAFLTASYN